MIIRRPPDIRSSEITPEGVYLNRRHFIRDAGLGAAALAFGAPAALTACTRDRIEEAGGEVAQQDDPNTYEEITSYNNFYEFGTGKEDSEKGPIERVIDRPRSQSSAAASKAWADCSSVASNMPHWPSPAPMCARTS